MTDHETEGVLALAGLYISDVSAKRFVNEMVWTLKVHPWVRISYRQSRFIWILVDRYRSHMPGSLVVTAEMELAGSQ